MTAAAGDGQRDTAGAGDAGGAGIAAARGDARSATAPAMAADARVPRTGVVGPTVADDSRRGMLYGVSAYVLWGAFPLYWALFTDWPALEVLAHRVVWSLVFCVVVLAVQGRLSRLRAMARRDVAVLAAASVLISLNWWVFIWATGNGRVVEASLGYFITPLVNVVLGVIVKRERLRPLQVGIVALASLGVAVLTWHVGAVPWVALVLAVSFGLYGLAKSLVRVPPLEGLTVETAIAGLPAVAIIAIAGTGGILASGQPVVTSLAVLAGPITAIPLLLFAGATRRLPLATVGLLQYLAPTLQFVVGVAILHEPFDAGRLVGFTIIWAALAMFAVDGARHARRVRRARDPAVLAR